MFPHDRPRHPHDDARPTGRRGVAAVVLLGTVVSACQITWREPEVQPLNHVVILPAELAPTCDQLRASFQLLGVALDQEQVENDACLFESAVVPLGQRGDPIQRLDEVAYVGDPGAFASGRYRLSASARPASEGNTRVRLATRIEGFDHDYRILRSRGLIERTVIARLTELLGVEPIQE